MEEKKRINREKEREKKEENEEVTSVISNYLSLIQLGQNTCRFKADIII